MNILISLSYYSPYISGLTVYAKNLAEGLSRSGHTVQILTSQHDTNLLLREQMNDVDVTRVPISLKIGKGPIMFGFIRPLIREVQKADIVNCHLPQFESVLVALLAKCFRKKIVLTYHTDLAVEPSFKGRFIRYGLYMAQIITGFLADVIVTQSSDYTKQSKYLTFFKKKVEAVYPPIIFPQVTDKQKHIFEKKISVKKKYRVGVVGRMAKEKGYEYLFDAIPFLKRHLGDDFVIFFAGPKNPIGEETYVKKITSQLVQNKDIVSHLGILNDAELGAFYENLDVFVLPSINTTEAFGMVQIEALSCGTPVVVTDLPGVRTTVKKTGYGEVAKVADAKDLAEHILSVLENKKKYQVDRKKIEKEFGIQNVLRQYEKIFR